MFFFSFALLTNLVCFHSCAVKFWNEFLIHFRQNSFAEILWTSSLSVTLQFIIFKIELHRSMNQNSLLRSFTENMNTTEFNEPVLLKFCIIVVHALMAMDIPIFSKWHHR